MALRFLFLLLLCSANALLPGQATVTPFDFSAPELVASLPDELAEISGLSLAHDRKDELLAVQDEDGIIYRINAAGRVLWSVDFWKEGDYEGIEVVGDDIWVVKSTGTLYHVTDIGLPTQHVDKYNTELTGDNDVEGLAYDPGANRLLLACKDDVRDDGNDKDGRYIFEFDLSSKKLNTDPVYAIRRSAVNAFLAKMAASDDRDKLVEFFDEDEKYDLAPSALAIEPATGHLYLTSSVGKMLMVLSSAGEILDMQRLPKRYFAQPEGLAFGPDGVLYISTEAKGKAPARIFRLRPQ